MDEPVTVTNMDEKLDKLRKQKLSAAQSVTGDFEIQRTEARIQQAKDIKETLDKAGTLTAIKRSAQEGFFEVGTKLGKYVGESHYYAQEAAKHEEGVLDTALTYADEFFTKSKTFDDPNWKPRENKVQRDIILDHLKLRGLDIESPEANVLLASRSGDELYSILDDIDKTKEKRDEIARYGNIGAAAYMASSLIDIDVAMGGGFFTKMRNVNKVRKLNKLQNAGKITKEQSDILLKTTTRGQNILAGMEVGAISAGATEALNVSLDDTLDTRNVLGAIVVGTSLGGVLGSAIKPYTVNNAVDDITTSELIRQAKQSAGSFIKRKPNYKATLKFTRDVEGGISTNPADRGGDTAFGISSKWFPRQYNEIMEIYQKKGERAALAYQGQFFKKEFWDKVVTDDMTNAQAKVMFDTAVNSGIDKAKELFEKAKGNVNKMIDLRAQFLEDLAIKDPSQQANIKGWRNRIQSLRDDIADTTPKGTQAIRNAIDIDQSVGAARVSGSEDAPVFTSSESSKIVQAEASRFLDENPDIDNMFRNLDEFEDLDAPLASRLAQRLGEYIYKGIQKTPFISDYDRLVRSAGNTGKWLAHLTMDSPVGQIVNNRSAHAVSDLLSRTAANDFAPYASTHYNTWAKDNNIPLISRRRFLEGQKEFSRELQTYRENLYMGRDNPDVHPSIKQASEDLDVAFNRLLEANKKYGVEGFEDIEYRKGYTPRKWDGDKFARIEEQDGIGSARVVQAIKKGILNDNPDINDQLALIFATAIRRSAKNRQLGSPMGSLMTVNTGGQAALEMAIQDLGIAFGGEATKMAEEILYKTSERGLVKSARRRIGLDMTTPIEGTNYTLMDLADNDVYGLADKAVRAQSNYAGLASVGIQNRDKDIWIQAAVDEANSLGLDPQEAAKAVRNTFSYFGDGAYAGGAGAIAGRLNKAAILTYLGQLGLTQLAEIGVSMGTAGIKGWTKYAKKTIPDMLKGKDPEILKSLGGAAHYSGDHRLFVRTDHLDDMDLNSNNQLLRMLDSVMDQGTRAMGYLSGFYKVNEMLHNVAALSMNDYMVRQIKNGIDNNRLKSMGVDPEFRGIINKHLDNGNIKFDADGNVSDMGVENWDADELDLLKIVTKRNVDQTVQRTRRGEGFYWQYEAVGSLFASLKSYTFSALQKQLVKNLRNADMESFSMIVATTGTAALAYTAKQIVNGNDKNLTPERIAKGALGWSSMLSPAMMAVDPLSYLIGADRMEGSPFPLNSWRYHSDGLIGMFSGISAVNDIAKILRVPSDLLDDGNLSNESINAVRSIPVIGRSFPMIPIINSLDNN